MCIRIYIHIFIYIYIYISIYIHVYIQIHIYQVTRLAAVEPDKELDGGPDAAGSRGEDGGRLGGLAVWLS